MKERVMQIGMTGLGRMGMALTERLIAGGHEIVAYDILRQNISLIEPGGATGADSLKDLTVKLKPPRVVWLMLPWGEPVDSTVSALSGMLSEGDIIVDGGNSHYKDDIRRAEILREKKIRFIDAGVSGGIWGMKDGFCIMLGGEAEDIYVIEPALKTIAAPGGYAHCGPAGAGHFVKMIHNGIEYGIMEAYGEGFELLKTSPYKEMAGLRDIAGLWNHGSVIRSWLLSLIEAALEADPELSSVSGFMEDTGMGRWTVEQAVETGVPAPVITAALYNRFRSRQDDTFSGKLIAALRREFGGHPVRAGRKRT